MTVRVDGHKEESIAFDPRQMRHFKHACVVTSHRSQGLTAEHTLVNVHTEVHSELTNSRLALCLRLVSVA